MDRNSKDRGELLYIIESLIMKIYEKSRDQKYRNHMSRTRYTENCLPSPRKIVLYPNHNPNPNPSGGRGNLTGGNFPVTLELTVSKKWCIFFVYRPPIYNKTDFF